MPWYTAPAALAEIAKITARPEVVYGECALSGRHLPDYAVPAALAQLHTAALKEFYAAPVFDEAAAGEALDASPSVILHAPFGSAGWMIEEDFGPLWQTIRDNLAAAKEQVAA